MKRLSRIMLCAAFLTLLPLPGKAQEVQQIFPGNQQNFQLIETLYVAQITNDVQITDEQVTRVLPLVRRWLQERRATANLRNRLNNQLNQAVRRGASEEEIRQLTEEFDKADPALLQQQFLQEIDAQLTPQQRARLRGALNRAEQRIQQVINQTRQANSGNAAAANERTLQQQEQQRLRQQKQQEAQQQRQQNKALAR